MHPRATSHSQWLESHGKVFLSALNRSLHCHFCDLLILESWRAALNTMDYIILTTKRVSFIKLHRSQEEYQV